MKERPESRRCEDRVIAEGHLWVNINGIGELKRKEKGSYESENVNFSMNNTAAASVKTLPTCRETYRIGLNTVC
jgi:hypothetical protein